MHRKLKILTDTHTCTHVPVPDVVSLARLSWRVKQELSIYELDQTLLRKSLASETVPDAV